MAVIRKLRSPLAPPTVGVVNEDGSVFLRPPGARKSRRAHITDEHKPGTRLYASWDTIQSLLARGEGEALTWGAQPVKWRHERRPDEEQWRPRPSDVSVLRVDFPDDDRRAHEGLARWRDWLHARGARPTGSLGGSALCLLRATIPHDVWTMRGDPPPIEAPLGARQFCAVDPGTSVSPAVHLDLPSAYPTVMGQLLCGDAIWRQVDKRELLRLPIEERHKVEPLIVEARVRVPDLPFGPLPERPTVTAPPDSWEHSAELEGAAAASYPTGKTITGVWGWPELAEARAAGCRVTPLRGWILVNDGTRPFQRWLYACREGRELPGFAAVLAKASANAAWGALVIGQGARAVVSYDPRRGRVRRLLPPLPGSGGRSWDMAELICGTVRAELARMMREVGPGLVTAHTDGGWCRAGTTPPPGWIVKTKAARLDVVGAQTLRYWPPGGRSARGPLYAVAGWPQRMAAEAFEADWSTVPKREEYA